MSWLVNGHWKSLEHINLASNGLRLEGVKQLLRAEWKSLRAIRIGRSSIRKRKIEGLSTAMRPNWSSTS
jgi:hypothetical protein